MNSLKTKITMLALGSLLFTSVVIGGAGVLAARSAVTSDSTQIMNLSCAVKAEELDALLGEIELSVDTLAIFAQNQLHSVQRLKTEPAYVDEYSRQLLDVTLNAAANTKGALTFYVRYDPTFTHPASGLFYSRGAAGEAFRRLTPTDFSQYSPSEVEHVGWFYIPVANQRGTWMVPYLNRNINVEMISYVVPFYVEDTLIGVVGMDIDIDVLRQIVFDTRVYESGTAFLTNGQAEVVYHRQLPAGTALASAGDGAFAALAEEIQAGRGGQGLCAYSYNGVRQQAAVQPLRNGMYLVLAAPQGEISARANRLVLQIALCAAGIVLVAAFVSVHMANRLIRPLQELNAAARRIAQGDLDVSIGYHSKDEIGALSESFRQTAKSLRNYIEYINALAYRDALTGTKNKTAYSESVTHMDDLIRMTPAAFAVAVFDINGLKVVNDTYGHDYGDELITEACRAICDSFKKSPVFRIGGDEFAVILEGGDFDNREALLELLEQALAIANKSRREELQISIARGVAVFTPGTDHSFADVFKRADSAMYQNKVQMKRARKTPPGH